MTDASTAEAIEDSEIDEVEAESIEESEVEESEVAETKEAEVSEDSSPEEEKKDSISKRIDELTRLRYEAQRERDYYREQFEKLRPEPELKADKTLADFDYDESAYSQHLLKVAKQQAENDLRTTYQQQQAAKAQAEYLHREAEYAKSVEDYEQVARNPYLPITQPMAAEIKSSDMGPQLLYHLGKNPDVAERLAALPPTTMARELGRIEARLSEVKPSVSKAPPPAPKIEAVEAKQKVSTTSPESDQMSTEEWFKAEQARLAKKFGR